MSNKRHKPEEIVTKLRQVEVLRGQGMAMADAVRQIGVSELTYYRWRKQYGGMSRDQLRQLKELQKENERLSRPPLPLPKPPGGGVGGVHVLLLTVIAAVRRSGRR